MTMEMTTAGDGCSIAYRWDGDARLPVLLLSNSIATDHRMWDNVVPDLSKVRRVLRYDTRGHGASGAPQGAYSLDMLGRDVLELLDHLGIETFDFCGLSLGGMVGQWLGVRAGERIDRLILSNTSPYLGPAGQWDELIAGLERDGDMNAMAEVFLGNWFPPAFRDAHHGMVDAFRRTILATPPHGLAGCFAAVRDMDLRRSNKLIRTSTLVVGGDHDSVTLPAHSREIAGAIPGAGLVLLPGVHILNVELPDAFQDLVRAFLAEGRIGGGQPL